MDLSKITVKKVLVADAVDNTCVELLKKFGVSVDCKYKLKEAELINIIKENYDGIIVRSDTKVTKAIINAGQNLKIIGRAGAGTDNIDIEAASKQNVVVINTPGGNAISACELTCSLITCLARNVAPAAASMREGRWDRKLYSGHELYGKTLAIIGLGRIGREIAIRMQAWGMKIIGYDPLVSKEQAEKFGVDFMSIEQLAEVADYVTVHVPLMPETRNLLNVEFFASCKPGIRVVNVARGGIINEADLLAAIESGQCAGAAFDVYIEEPPTSATTLALIKHPKVLATPHLGASTGEAQVRVAVEVAEQFLAFTELGAQKYKVNKMGIVNLNI